MKRGVRHDGARRNGRRRVISMLGLTALLVGLLETVATPALAAPIFSDDFASAQLRELDVGHAAHDRQRHRPAGLAERPGTGHGPVGVRLSAAWGDLPAGVHERERQPGLGVEHRAAPSPNGDRRRDPQGLRVGGRRARDPLRRGRHPAGLDRRAGIRVAQRRGLRLRWNELDMGPVPGRCSDRERVAGRHRHDAGRPDHDRRQLGQDVHRQLRPCGPRPGGRRRGADGHDAAEHTRSAHGEQSLAGHDPDLVGRLDGRVAPHHLPGLP